MQHGAAVFATTLATVLACYKELNATPAHLMRPKAPQMGKIIILERITFLWSKLTFIQKITCRNIFRYKKRLLMTIVGIAGCTSLIYTGFALKDSIVSIADKQYGEIRVYDIECTIRNETSDIETIEDEIQKRANSQEMIFLRQQSVEIGANNETKEIYAVVSQTGKDLGDFIQNKDRKTAKEIALTDEGVVITEKLSKQLQVNVGDTIDFIVEDNPIPIKVIGITENYIYHYAFMTEHTYQTIYQKQVLWNQVLINIQDSDAEDISKELLKMDDISSLMLTEKIGDTFGGMIDSLSMVVVVLIISAGALAFVVLFNLNSINIEERKRELATIKLLGFYDKEVSSYVFRENIILTIIGAILGMGLGILVHLFVITTAEVDIIMFSRDRNFLSFLYSFVITIFFALTTNLIMQKSLKKIDMVESLKSVE